MTLDRLGCRSERGAATGMLVLLTLALFTVAGLVIDGGGALAAQRRGRDLAEQAARVGADQVDVAQLRSGTRALDAGRASEAAQRFLSSAGVRGSVRVEDQEVTVTVTGSYDTRLLSAVGLSGLQYTESATSVSVIGSAP